MNRIQELEQQIAILQNELDEERMNDNTEPAAKEFHERIKSELDELAKVNNFDEGFKVEVTFNFDLEFDRNGNYGCDCQFSSELDAMAESPENIIKAFPETRHRVLKTLEIFDRIRAIANKIENKYKVRLPYDSYEGVVS